MSKAKGTSIPLYFSENGIAFIWRVTHRTDGHVGESFVLSYEQAIQLRERWERLQYTDISLKAVCLFLGDMQITPALERN